MTRTLIFAATFNEKDNVIPLVDRISGISREFDILIVDDNSPDGTGELLDRIAAKNPRVRIIRRPAKLGLGTAHHLAMLYAIKLGYDHLVTMDADLSHEPEDIPRLISGLTKADFAIGSRYMPGGKCDYTGYRRVVSVAANVAARLLLGIPLHEFTTSFRAFRVQSLTGVNFVKLHNQGYSFFMESIYRLSQAGLLLTEVPINFRDRYSGTSKIPRLEIFRGMLKLVHLSASRLLGRKMLPPAPHPEDRCASCGSIYMSERFPEDLSVASDGEASNTYRCSSMAHARKPRVVKCLECGLSQIPKSDQPTELAELYGEVVDNDYLNNIPAKRRTFARAYERISDFVRPPGRMLEIGSYCGLFLQEAQCRGWAVTGIEPSKWAADYSRDNFGLNVFNGTLERVRPQIHGEFDAVVSWDVIEHVADPKRFLEDAHTMLRAGGVLAVSTIDIDSRFARIAGQRWPWIMEMHLYYFGCGVLEHMFRAAGFEVLRVEPYRHYASLRYIYRKLCGVVPSAGNFLAGGAKLVPQLIVPVSLGDVKVYVGRKI